MKKKRPRKLSSKPSPPRKHTHRHTPNDEILPEYDASRVREGVRGQYASRYAQNQTTIRQLALQAVEQLPDDVAIEDIMERLYFLAKVERGRGDARAGRVVSHKELGKRLRV